MSACRRFETITTYNVILDVTGYNRDNLVFLTDNLNREAIIVGKNSSGIYYKKIFFPENALDYYEYTLNDGLLELIFTKRVFSIGNISYKNINEMID
jgi:hypothetical protein